MESILNAFIELFNLLNLAIDIFKAMYEAWIKNKSKIEDCFFEMKAPA